MESFSRDPTTKKPKEIKTKTLRHHLKLSEFRLQWSMVAVLAIILAVFTIKNPRVFLSFRIYYSFMSIIPFMAILALALTPVVICKEMDLSFPSILGFSAWMFTSLSASTGNPTFALAISLITGLLAGLLNGILVVKVGVPSLIITIGTMFFRSPSMISYQSAVCCLTNASASLTSTRTLLPRSLLRTADQLYGGIVFVCKLLGFPEKCRLIAFRNRTCEIGAE